jgi:hypothetical protein
MSNWDDAVDSGNIKRGTTAIHQLGDISRENGDYFYADKKVDDNWIGAWLTGFGFMNVKFPVDTVSELTDEQKQELKRLGPPVIA